MQDGRGVSPDLLALLPHRPPMLMIDALVAIDDRSATAAKTFRSGAYGTDGDRVAEVALIEGLAQTTAAIEGHAARQRGQPPAQGLLVGVSDFTFHRDAPVGRTLTLEVEVARRLPPLLLVSGRVRLVEVVIAEGSLKFYLPEKR